MSSGGTARRCTCLGRLRERLLRFDPGSGTSIRPRRADTGAAARHGRRPRRGADASFLALAVSPAARRGEPAPLARLGAEGKYGFYEAVDFTPSRLCGGARDCTSYMAHHLGMSLVAVDNALGDNVMQRRFLRDPAMNAFRELLQEKVPVGAVIMRDPVASVPERARRVSDEPWRRAGEGVNPGKPRAHLLSNGSYTVTLTDTGFADELWEGISLARCTPMDSTPASRFSCGRESSSFPSRRAALRAGGSLRLRAARCGRALFRPLGGDGGAAARLRRPGGMRRAAGGGALQPRRESAQNRASVLF
jgi:hypothetical protein